MVVLSAAVVNRSGKALIARQFVEMTRIRIEGLLAAFPKLVGSDIKQHTYVETDSVRYLYQPLDNLFLLLVTNRASNIVEDLETLRLLSKVVPDVIESAQNISEEKISEHCFELIFAFDEVSIKQKPNKSLYSVQNVLFIPFMEFHSRFIVHAFVLTLTSPVFSLSPYLLLYQNPSTLLIKGDFCWGLQRAHNATANPLESRDGKS